MQEVTGSSPVPSTKTTRLIRVGSFCFGGRYRTRTARAERSEGNQSPSGALISARFPTARNVYQERCRQTIRSGDFFRGGRYRARTARHRRRRGNKHPSGVFVSARFPTPRNVYRDDCRFVVGGTGQEPEQAKAGYHHGCSILPFAILNRVCYTRLSSTNLHLED